MFSNLVYKALARLLDEKSITKAMFVEYVSWLLAKKQEDQACGRP
jgi:hypothetical protein